MIIFMIVAVQCEKENMFDDDVYFFSSRDAFYKINIELLKEMVYSVRVYYNINGEHTGILRFNPLLEWEKYTSFENDLQSNIPSLWW